jgi:hypothetical protein
MAARTAAYTVITGNLNRDVVVGGNILLYVALEHCLKM